MNALKIATVATTIAIGMTTQQAHAQSIFPNLFNWGGQTQLTNANWLTSNTNCGPNGCAIPAGNQGCFPTNALPAYPVQNGVPVQNWSTDRPAYPTYNAPQVIGNSPPRNRLDTPHQTDYRIQPYPQNFTYPQNYNAYPYSNVNQGQRTPVPGYDPRFPTPTYTNYYQNSNVPQHLPASFGQNVPNL